MKKPIQQPINSRLKKIIFLLAFYTFPLIVQAEEVNLRAKLNDILKNWMLPLFVFILVIVFLVKFAQNFSLIADKNNDGSTMEGFKNVGMALAYVLVGEVVLTAIVVGANAMIDGINL